eukprot:gene21078-23132_t
MAADFGTKIEQYLYSVLERTEGILGEDIEDVSQLELHECLLDKTSALLCNIKSYVSQNENAADDADDIRILCELESIFSELESKFCIFSQRKKVPLCYTPEPLRLQTGAPGRPSYFIPPELLEELRGKYGLSWNKISGMLKVSHWTIARRVNYYGLQDLQNFSPLTNDEIDTIVKDYNITHGATTGESYLRGHFRALGYHIQRRRIRESINRVDPRNTALRWGALVSRRTYFVPWPNSVWHIDDHHSLIRWGMVIHGCIDGKTRRIIFLKAATNNLASTVLHNFEEAIEEDGGLWPSRIRVDYGVENVAVCDAMVVKRGTGRSSFMCGSSTRNQRIERLWRDVYRCVCHIFYYLFYGMEQSGLVDVENNMYMFALQRVFLGRLNLALEEWKLCHNHHPLSTEHGWSPNQLWLEGMTDPRNPLARGEVEDNSDPINDGYLDDPFQDQANNVIVLPASIDLVNPLQDILPIIDNICNPNRVSNSFGVDIYMELLEFLQQN